MIQDFIEMMCWGVGFLLGIAPMAKAMQKVTRPRRRGR